MHIPPGFQKKQAKSLQSFFAAKDRSPDSMKYCEAVGFLFVVACAPEMINPSEWLPVIVDEAELGDIEHKETQEVLAALMSLYNELNRQVQESDVALPHGCRFLENPEDNFNPDAPMHQWCRGFVGGHQWLEEVWSEYIPEDLDEEFGALFIVLSFFANREAAEELHADNTSGNSMQQMAADLQDYFPKALGSFADMGRIIQTVLREQAQEPVVTNKVGRNEPCPCGSGKKYKKCCALKLH